MGECQPAEQDVVDSNSVQTNMIMLAVIWDLVSVKIIVSLGGDLKPLALALSLTSFFH